MAGCEALRRIRVASVAAAAATVGAPVLLALTMASTAAAASPDLRGTSRIVIQAENQAHLPLSVLRAAEKEVTRIYRMAGVESSWVEVAPDGSGSVSLQPASASDLHLLIMVVPRQTTEAMQPPAGAMGVTPREPGQRSRVAYVFADRVERAAQMSDNSVAGLLGCAIAHELGHMLLPYPAHSDSGIMRAAWTADDMGAAAQGRLMFTPEQGKLIRVGLSQNANSRSVAADAPVPGEPHRQPHYPVE